MKPELIAPIVFWLCHENCTENGSIIEAALGWAGKCELLIIKFYASDQLTFTEIFLFKEIIYQYIFIGHLVRSSGCVLRQNLSANVTPENVQENWSKVIDMTSAKRFDSIQVKKFAYIFVLISFYNHCNLFRKQQENY